MSARVPSVVATITFWLWLLTLVFVDLYFPAVLDTPGGKILINVLFLALILFWVEADAARRCFQITRPWRYFIVFTGPIGISAFVIRSRGVPQYLWFIVKFAVCAALWMLLAFGGLLVIEVAGSI